MCIRDRIGSLLLDASYSPILRVSYNVDNARVEQRTDLDKLVIDLESNGTLDPEEAIRRAATILQQQVAVFVDLEREKEPEAEEKEEEIEEAEKEIHKARQEAKVENSEEGGSESSSEQSDPSKWKWEADSEEKPKSEKSPNLIQAFTEMVNGQDKGFCADAAKEFLNCCNQINPPKTKEEFQKLTSEFQKIFIDSATPLLTSFMEGKKTSEKSEKKQQSESSEQSDEDQKRINLDSIGDLLEFVLT